jgi:predicted amidohydrolase
MFHSSSYRYFKAYYAEPVIKHCAGAYLRRLSSSLRRSVEVIANVERAVGRGVILGLGRGLRDTLLDLLPQRPSVAEVGRLLVHR